MLRGNKVRDPVIKLWKNVPGKFFCISIGTPSADGKKNVKWKDCFFSRDEFGDIPQFLRDNRDKNIYFCPHGFNRRVRQSEEAVVPNLLWADLDESSPENKKLFKGIRPALAIQSSPGRYAAIWHTDKVPTEDLNRRLTYYTEADKGGWGLTKVLRYPGTKNFKYKTEPTVRVLWDEERTLKLKKLRDILPEEDDYEGDDDLDPSDVFAEYEKKLPKWVRRALLATKIPGRQDRSEMLWRLENECLEAGMSMDEAFAVIKRSIWNKFSGRRNEDEILRRELEKAVDLKFRQKPKGKDKRKQSSDEEDREEEEGSLNGRHFNFKSLKEIEEREIDWIWYPYMARQEITIVEGDPGFGKSYFVQMVCGMVASGTRIPNYYKGRKRIQGPIVYFDVENTASTVTKPRLEENGFNDLENYYPVEEFFTIDDEEALDEIYDFLEEVQPAMVVFDTLNTYIGRADTHKASETAQAMADFKRIAQKFNCSVVVVRHLTKGGGSVHYRGQGSQSIIGSARLCIVVGADPEDTDSRAFALHKSNIGVYPPAGRFRIEERPKGRSAFIWGGFTWDLTPQMIADAAHAAQQGKKGNSLQDAMEFLEANAGNKWVEVDRLLKMAEKRGISPDLVERAANKMNVKKKDRKGTQLWKLIVNNVEPEEDDED